MYNRHYLAFAQYNFDDNSIDRKMFQTAIGVYDNMDVEY